MFADKNGTFWHCIFSKTIPSNKRKPYPPLPLSLPPLPLRPPSPLPLPSCPLPLMRPLPALVCAPCPMPMFPHTAPLTLRPSAIYSSNSHILSLKYPSPSSFSCQSLRAWHFYCRLCKVPICQEITFNFRSVPSINRSRVDILALRRWRECIDTRPALTYNNRTSQPQAESAHQQGTPPKLVPRHTNLKKGSRHWTMIL